MTTLRIFLVDDDLFYLSLMEQQLLGIGCTDVTLFSDSASFLDNLHRKPDVIFLDYNLDNLTGYEVLQKIKRYDPNLYVVMVSGQEDIKPAVDTLKHGAFDYIQKGGNDDEAHIRTVLQRIIDIREMLKASKPSLLNKLRKLI